MSELTDFLEARLAEDETAAREALALSSIYDQETVRWHWIVTHKDGHTWHPGAPDPARVLVEVEAKRAILRRCHASNGYWGYDVERMLAAPYRDHPGYQEGWAL